MKTIVIAGARSNVGKTTLAGRVRELLPGAEVVKLGHHPPDPGRSNHYYLQGTPYTEIAGNHSRSDWLIIESNGILKEMTPDLCVFLDADNEKPSARSARQKADIMSGTRYDEHALRRFSDKSGLPPEILRRILWLAGARPEPATAIILAGGKSSRMGRDKSGLRIGSRTLLDRAQEMVMPLFDQVIVSLGEQDLPVRAGIAAVRDERPGQGPLMGLFSALRASGSRVNFVMACDIPEVNRPTLYRLLSQADDYDIVVPSVKKDFTEPLFAVYSREILPRIEHMLEQGGRKMLDLFTRCRTRICRVEGADWYYNVNTPDDYERYLTTRGSAQNG